MRDEIYELKSRPDPFNLTPRSLSIFLARLMGAESFMVNCQPMPIYEVFCHGWIPFINQTHQYSPFIVWNHTFSYLTFQHNKFFRIIFQTKLQLTIKKMN